MSGHLAEELVSSPGIYAYVLDLSVLTEFNLYFAW